MRKKKVNKTEAKPKPEGYVFGRPTEYKPEYCDMLIEHMSKGLSFESFAGVLRMSNKTLYTWAEKQPDFLHAKQVGIDMCRLFWEKLGVEYVINISESHKDGDSSSHISKSLNAKVYDINMKNRFGWADKQEIKQELTAAVDMVYDTTYGGKTLEELTKDAKK